ncbi:MAG: hypothetical protein HC788_08240, partial [Sphingopyxis sp.]|nr:hypothetical protein [Sphingopyxis sp.]
MADTLAQAIAHRMTLFPPATTPRLIVKIGSALLVDAGRRGATRVACGG